MKSTRFAAVLMLAAALMTSQVAVADALPFSSGILETTTEKLSVKMDDKGGFSAFFGHVFTSDSTYGKLFTNDFTFDIGYGGLTAGSVTASFAGNGKDVYISGFNVFDSAKNIIYTGINKIDKSDQARSLDYWVLPENSKLGAGSYYLEVTGQVLGHGGGSYAGDLQVEALSEVPEPSTHFMMAGGLALLGFMSRRKKGVNNANHA